MKLPTFIFVVILAAAVLMAACGGNSGVALVNADSDGLAVHGYDTVAFFVGDTAVKGNPTLEYAWNGAKWIFANAENLEKFKADPEAFAPQFGGYCSYAVSHGYTADGDPQTWKIVDGKLYLNYNQKAKEAWELEQEKFIEDGNKNWAEFRITKPQHKG